MCVYVYMYVRACMYVCMYVCVCVNLLICNDNTISDVGLFQWNYVIIIIKSCRQHLFIWESYRRHPVSVQSWLI